MTWAVVWWMFGIIFGTLAIAIVIFMVAKREIVGKAAIMIWFIFNSIAMPIAYQLLVIHLFHH